MLSNARRASSLSEPDAASRLASTTAFSTDSVPRDSLVFGSPRVWSG